MNPSDVYTCLENCLKHIIRNPRPGIVEVLKKFSEYLSEYPRVRKVFVVDLPTGYGKSTLSIIFAKAVKECLDVAERVLHVVPTRSLVRDLVLRARRYGVEAYGQYMGIEQSLKSSLFLADLVFTTIDSYALNMFKIPVSESKYLLKLYLEGEEPLGHFEVPRYAIYTAINVFDEYHLIAMPTRFDSRSVLKPMTTLFAMLKVLTENSVPLVMETATHVESFLRLLRSYSIEVRYIGFDPSMDRDFVEARCSQRIATKLLYSVDFEDIVDDIASRVEDLWQRGYRRICVAMNTVERALEIYERLRQLLGTEALLLHSRFRRVDLEEKVRSVEDRRRPCIVVTTQVIEVGVDLDFDAMITELAPLPSLVQRIGRVCRDPYRDCTAEVYIVVDWSQFGEGKEFYTVYDAVLTWRTLEALQRCRSRNSGELGIEWKLPFSHDGLISYVELAKNIYEGIDVSKYIDNEVLSQLENIAKRYVHTPKDSLEVLERKFKGSFVRDDALVSVYLASECREGVAPEDLEEYSLALPLYALLHRDGKGFRDDLLCTDNDRILAVIDRDGSTVMRWISVTRVLNALRNGMLFIEHGGRLYMVSHLVGKRERYDAYRGFV